MSTQTNADAAFAEFYQATPAYHEFHTAPNLQMMAEFIVSTWGESAGANPSSWEIAFLELKDKLVPNPDYISKATRDRIKRMSVEDLKRAIRTEPGFPDLWERYSNENPKIASNDPYATLTAAEYQSIPPIQRARLYAEQILFRNATERLIVAGEI